MRAIAIRAYDECKIGESCSMRPKDGSRLALEEFQHDAALAERWEREGKILIQKKHNESETGKNFVDIIIFKRIS